MTGPVGIMSFVSLDLNFSSGFASRNTVALGEKNNCFPLLQSLSAYYNMLAFQPEMYKGLQYVCQYNEKKIKINF